MTRYERLEKAGVKVINVMGRPTGMEGSVHGKINGRLIRATSITDLHKQYFGY